MSARLDQRFAALKAHDRAGLIAYVMAHDPNADIALEILTALPHAGADIIELGFPFSDPMADGPSIQHAGERSLKAGGSLRAALDLLARFRAIDFETPVILMGYANPVVRMGADEFAAAAAGAGADGAIIVDLPPEEDAQVRTAMAKERLPLIRLTAPTTDDHRLERILDGANGFVYHVSVAGVTGARAAVGEVARAAAERLKRHTKLPIAVGFGVRDGETAAEIARAADAVVVGSAFVDVIAREVEAGRAHAAPAAVAKKVHEISAAIRSARGRKGVTP